MPPLAVSVVPFLNALLLTMFLAMLMAWGWAIQQVAARRPLLPPPRPAEAPWGR